MINLNTQILPQLPDDLASTQRALFYSDSLFETLRVFNGRMPFLAKHLSRLRSGLSALHYDIPFFWTSDFFEREILKIAPSNARVRLSVWRSPGGLYRPADNTPQFLITAEPLPSANFEWPETGLSLGICEDVRLPMDAFSNFKTLNAPRYVAAALEAQAKGWDDALLLNSAGRPCEATSSNLFWVKGTRFYTPPLTEACVAGVMRQVILEKSTDFSIREKKATMAKLASADEIFLTNAVRGIKWVRAMGAREYGCEETRRLIISLQKNF